MLCHEIQEKLNSYIDSELEDQQMREIEKHLEQCIECKEMEMALRETIERVKELEITSLPEGFSDKLHENLIKERKSKLFLFPNTKNINTRKWKKVGTIFFPTIAVASILFVLITTGNRKSHESENMTQMSQGITESEDSNYQADMPQEEAKMNMEITSDPQMTLMDQESDVTGNSVISEETQHLKQRIDSNDIGAISQRKIIKRANLFIEVEDFDFHYDKIRFIVNQFNGYIENTSLNNQGIDRQNNPLKEGNLILRIPKENYESVIKELQNMGDLKSFNESSEDVTRQYLDLQTRIKTLQVQEERLLEIMKKSDKIEDVIKLETRLSEIRTEIEMHQVNTQNIDQLSSLSTVEVYLKQVQKYEKLQNQPSLISKMKGSFISSINHIKNNLGEILIWISGNVLRILFFIILGVLGKKIYKRIRNKLK